MPERTGAWIEHQFLALPAPAAALLDSSRMAERLARGAFDELAARECYLRVK